MKPVKKEFSEDPVCKTDLMSSYIQHVGLIIIKTKHTELVQ